MVAKRKIDWQEQLLVQTLIFENQPFEWGKADCCLFAADAVIAMTGVDHAKDFRGKYTTEIGAKRLLSKKGGLETFLDTRLKVIPVDYVQRGDVVLIRTDTGPTLGIYWSGRSAWMQGLDGVKLFMEIKARIIKAWRV